MKINALSPKVQADARFQDRRSVEEHDWLIERVSNVWKGQRTSGQAMRPGVLGREPTNSPEASEIPEEQVPAA